MKRIVYCLLSLAMAATMLTGCGSQSSKEGNTVENVGAQGEKQEKVVVACRGTQILDKK